MWIEERRRMMKAMTTSGSRFNEIALNPEGAPPEIKHACLPYWLKIS